MIEAGLGGRLDATNTIPSRVTVLTSIGLDHTEWLGETELEIAAEKLAVLRDQTTLVLGPGLAPRSRRWPSGRRPSAAPGWCVAPEDPGPEVRAARRRAASSAATSPSPAPPPRPSSASSTPTWSPRSAATVTVPGRLERVAEDPPTFLDAAHNPDGAAALAEALPAVAAGRRVVACLAILADKDARGDDRGPGPGARPRRLHRAARRRRWKATGRPGGPLAPGGGAGGDLRGGRA